MKNQKNNSHLSPTVHWNKKENRIFAENQLREDMGISPAEIKTAMPRYWWHSNAGSIFSPSEITSEAYEAMDKFRKFARFGSLEAAQRWCESRF